MANISSQKKRIRQDEKKNLRNKDKKTALRSSIKAILNSEDTVEKEQKDNVIRNLDRAYTNGIVTKNFRDRNKSKISKL
ncbi:30S ribosomal protein S20 [Acidimicrobiaceae bacterium]|nr:30S ribosomal protein S20 [Acidimicrobiaceae bacterium]|tara:strand:- start:292 stop:528 length:237 start_codon:yes stop_codon:yes gene_type:complete